MSKVEPEFASIEAFVQFCMDDERDTFLPGEAQKVAAAIKRNLPEVVAELKSYGLTPVTREVKSVRGINSNNHDLYTAKNGWVTGCGIGSTSRHMVSGWQPT